MQDNQELAHFNAEITKPAAHAIARLKVMRRAKLGRTKYSNERLLLDALRRAFPEFRKIFEQEVKAYLDELNKGGNDDKDSDEN
jgi:hypothetical protein